MLLFPLTDSLWAMAVSKSEVVEPAGMYAGLCFEFLDLLPLGLAHVVSPLLGPELSALPHDERSFASKGAELSARGWTRGRPGESDAWHTLGSDAQDAQDFPMIATDGSVPWSPRQESWK